MDMPVSHNSTTAASEFEYNADLLSMSACGLLIRSNLCNVNNCPGSWSKHLLAQLQHIAHEEIEVVRHSKLRA